MLLSYSSSSLPPISESNSIHYLMFDVLCFVHIIAEECRESVEELS